MKFRPKIVSLCHAARDVVKIVGAFSHIEGLGFTQGSARAVVGRSVRRAAETRGASRVCFGATPSVYITCST